MSLQTLPNELLLLIVSSLHPRDLKHLVETNRRLSTLLTPHLHKHALQSKDGLSALCWACKKGHLPLVTLLLSWGLPLDAPSGPYRKSPLQVAVTWNREPVVSLLIARGADLECRDIRRETALHQAVEACYSSESTVRSLLAAGANIKARSKTGQSALHLAVECGDEGITRVLLGAGADPNEVSDLGATPLHCAMHLRRPVALVRLLMDAGANPRGFVDGMTKPPLHLAVDRRDVTLARVLLEGGADLDVLDGDSGDAPIHRAIKNSHEEMFALLLGFGASLVVQDRSGKDALAVARYRGERRMEADVQLKLGLPVADLSLGDGVEAGY